MLSNLWQIRVTAENLKLQRANLRAARNHSSVGTVEGLKEDLRNEIAKLKMMIDTEEQKGETNPRVVKVDSGIPAASAAAASAAYELDRAAGACGIFSSHRKNFENSLSDQLGDVVCRLKAEMYVRVPSPRAGQSADYPQLIDLRPSLVTYWLSFFLGWPYLLKTMDNSSHPQKILSVRRSVGGSSIRTMMLAPRIKLLKLRLTTFDIYPQYLRGRRDPRRDPAKLLLTNFPPSQLTHLLYPKTYPKPRLRFADLLFLFLVLASMADQSQSSPNPKPLPPLLLLRRCTRRRGGGGGGARLPSPPPRLKAFESSVGLSRKAFRLGKFVQDVNSLRCPSAAAAAAAPSAADRLLAAPAYGGEGLYYFVEQFVWLAKAGHPRRARPAAPEDQRVGRTRRVRGSIALKLKEVKKIRSTIESKTPISKSGKCDGIEEEEEEMKRLREKLLLKHLSIVQDLADGLMALGDVREAKGFLASPLLMASAGLLSAVISTHKNWIAC
uniref:Uncharacterized protein n=1 Tax=Ananas comosus var. bracteatus TaxID=296719 RepID=A0A6V7PR38_ANACO|nr:unnamed protein product [Ananas comosus var. bracteatus]